MADNTLTDDPGSTPGGPAVEAAPRPDDDLGAGGTDSGEVTNVLDEENADWHRAQAEDYVRQQEQAADAGDYEDARDLAARAADEFDVSASAGADVEAEIIDAEQDEGSLSEAVWDEEIADGEAFAAEDYAEEGDYDTAERYGEDAVEHAEVADEYGDEGGDDYDAAGYDA